MNKQYFPAKPQEESIYISDTTLYFSALEANTTMQLSGGLLFLISQLILKTRMSNDSCLEITGKYVRKTFKVSYYNESVVQTVYFMDPNDTIFIFIIRKCSCELVMALDLRSNQFSLTCGINVFYCSHHAFMCTAKGFRRLSGLWVYKFISMGVVP